MLNYLEPGLRRIFDGQTEELAGGRIHHFVPSVEELKLTDRIHCEYCGSSPMHCELINGTCPNCGGPLHG